jgi:hypothetical protein
LLRYARNDDVNWGVYFNQEVPHLSIEKYTT